ncbi:MAG: hypothetical protein U1F53_19570 [Burkholderiaceae bacterium]
MSRLSARLARATPAALALALAAAASPSFADPISLEAVCHVSSVVPGQGKCELTYLMSDGFSPPASVRKAQIKVNGAIVAQSVNDSSNPAVGFATYVSGGVAVACSASYTVRGYIARVGSGTYEEVGTLPLVTCPAAP